MPFNWKLLVVVLIVFAFLFLVLYRNKKCKQAGERLGVPYRCKFFDCEPVTLIAEDHYYGKRDGKCYEFIDYGNNMSIRRVPMEHCGESEPKKKSDVVEDAEYFFDDEIRK